MDRNKRVGRDRRHNPADTRLPLGPRRQQAASAARPPSAPAQNDHPRQFSKRSGAALLWLLGLCIGAYLVGLLVQGSTTQNTITLDTIGWLATLSGLACVLVCWIAAARSRARRPDIILAATAVTSTVFADTVYYLQLQGSPVIVSPLPADVGYVLFYVFMVAALIVLVFRRLRPLGMPVLLDTLSGSFGAAAILAAVLDPVLVFVAGTALTGENVLGLLFPVGDLVLVALIAAIATAESRRAGRRWMILAAGLLLFTAADVTYALGLPTAQYVVGSVLDAGWAVGVAVIAVWVHRSTEPETPHPRPGNTWWTVVTPATATAGGLAVLLLGTQLPLTPLPIILATLSLVVATVPLAYRQQIARRLARTDDLTGLLNRRAFRADAAGRLVADRPHALLVLDLDRFKELNDSLGHEAGDHLLTAVGTQISTQLRSGDLVGRLGGDEFGILLAGASRERAIATAERLRHVVAEPMLLEGITLQTNVSIGIALYPEQGSDLNQLMRKADMAMYRSKAGNTGPHVYAAADNQHGAERLRTLQELRLALAHDQLQTYFQPKVDLTTNTVTGAEALVRWNHPTRGVLGPGEFLGLAEESGLMDELTLIVLCQALDQAARWHRNGHLLTVSVNLAPGSLADDRLADWVGDLLDARGLPSELLMLEITEEFLIADRPRAQAILTSLRRRGIRISIDDFGTGYSSLSYLRDLPIDEIKLDQSFVLPMMDCPRTAALVAAAVGLVHSLDLPMVAEGIEDAEALAELIRLGCDVGQGYFFSRPLPAADFERWIDERRELAGTS
ncbi:EAL domain-containing protein [Cryobacterium melibiosiphilum]|uniref:EAL domain-containing protein n=1 Tax=Cryobacterium melibiosiphilum TaxID=995039 RepID=A0A3A5MNH3_9MICO|nr:EAL domain-containing protein [Cryobacterium melibiosiphilum]RJT90621.1 EAL domain-containing protein [Cryobacterium melibiosiphilum]